MHEPVASSEDEVVPTITTVARLANVSVASASRVLNGIRTSPATLERVTAAAESVGYAPNAAARSLRSRRTGQIAFAMPDVGNPVYTAMVASIQEVARVAGVRLLLHSTGADPNDCAAESSVMVGAESSLVIVIVVVVTPITTPFVGLLNARPRNS